ncbi:prephenate dehydratase [Caldivirga maquilingensis]|uniref:prephenate dehydratase n=1 Tax=Caldivirga maquilingensis (strain ATCC 700844 / DSM 13496 / JCM 10307 / IC-167) TaxID=397948 RepID=A8M8V1_CALMQ|nr:Prephenate dehydratase [Caldivirga maquilingensis IC-167]
MVLSVIKGYLNSNRKVAYLGPEGTFSHEVALMLLNGTMIPVKGINDIVKGVYNGQFNYGVVPFENNLAGIVGDTIDALIKWNVGVKASVEYRVSLCLVVNNDVDSLSEIKEIYSHPHAIEESKEFLSGLNATIRQTSSTAEALNMVIGHRERAAVASRLGAQLRGLKTITCGIEDKPSFTKFLILQRDVGNIGDRSLVIFSVPNKPGSLYSALKPFAEAELNLTMIYSRPNKMGPWEYDFILEVECSLSDGKCLKAINELREHSAYVKILGSYRYLTMQGYDDSSS